MATSLMPTDRLSTVDEHVERIVESLQPLPPYSQPLLEAVGLPVCEHITAPIDLPAFEGPSTAITAKVQEAPRAQPQTPARQVQITPARFKSRSDRIAAAISACYPSASRRLSEEGRVVATITVGADGKAGAVTVTQSSGFPRLDAAVECVVRRLPFEPGKRDGQPVDSQVSVPIVFKLE